VEKLIQGDLFKCYHSTRQRILLLDFEGTLVDEDQKGNEADMVLSDLVADPRNSVVVLSDSTPTDLSIRIKDARITLVAESGGFVRGPRGHWQQAGDFYLTWKEPVSHALRRLAQRYPDTSIVEKHFSIRWNYGKGIAHLQESDQRQLKAAFRIISNQYNVPMVETSSSIEFREAGINKARFVASWMNMQEGCDFILSIGDDKSDEDVFKLIGRKFMTVRVGYDPASAARYYLQSRAEVVPLLKSLTSNI
jgi:trehalose 6-phosphate synthase/phosphatase